MPDAANPKIRVVPPPPAFAASDPQPPYAELAVTSNFSFLRGGSFPDELVFRAAELGYRAIALTDRNTLAGVVRAHAAAKQAKETGLRFVVGCRLVLTDAPDVLVWPTDRAAYGRLCRLLTLGKRRAGKGGCVLTLADLLDHRAGLLAAVVPPDPAKADASYPIGLLADAFGSLACTRRPAAWRALALADNQLPLFPDPLDEDDIDLPPMPLGQEVLADYATGGLSLKAHPVSLVRTQLTERRVIASSKLRTLHRGWVRVAGLVLIRQRPGTASGVVFVTIEDETGVANLIVTPAIFDAYRPAARHATFLQADGIVQRQGEVIHVHARKLHDLGGLLTAFTVKARDFH